MALDWLDAEQAVLVAAVDHAAAEGFDTHTWQLAWTLVTFLYRRGHWQDMLTTGTAAVAAARRAGDRTAEANAHPAIKITEPFHGAILDHRHGKQSADSLTIRVSGQVNADGPVTVNGYLRSLVYLRMPDQSEVAERREHQHRSAIHFGPGAGMGREWRFVVVVAGCFEVVNPAVPFGKLRGETARRQWGRW